MTPPAYGAQTDPGLVRTSNQDRVFARPPLFAVADGMGGQAAGEVAAQIVVDTLAHATSVNQITDGGSLRGVLQDANRLVRERARAVTEFRGMGTTCSALLIVGSVGYVAHVGDSRGYLIRGGRIRLLTRDHTPVATLVNEGVLTEQEGATHPQRHILSRAIGASDEVEVDLDSVGLEPGDRVLLCSDGLSGMVPDAEIERIMSVIQDPEAAAAELVEAAIAGGGHDNVSVLVIDPALVVTTIGPEAEPAKHRPVSAEPTDRGRARRRWVAAILAILAILAMLAVALLVGQRMMAPTSPVTAPTTSTSAIPSTSPDASAPETTPGTSGGVEPTGRPEPSLPVSAPTLPTASLVAPPVAQPTASSIAP